MPRPLVFDPATPTATREILRLIGATPNRLLGQNFLVNAPLLDKIADSAELSPEDNVLEVGPGLGSLTVRLLARAGQVTAIEKDSRFAGHLRSQLHRERFNLVVSDALEVQWEDLSLPDSGVKVVANLPYSISKPILRRFLEDWRPHLASATVLVQREVANRLVAKPGSSDYGPMGIAARLYGQPKKMFDISPGSFLPAPDVVSTVVHIELLPTPSIELADETAFWRVVRAAFAQRRKTLGNTLKAVAPRERLENAFAQTGIDPQRRGETLSLEEYAALTAALL